MVHAILLVTSISLTIVLFLYSNTDRKRLAIALLACGILVLIGAVVFGVGWAMIYLNETLVQRIEEAWYVLLASQLEGRANGRSALYAVRRSTRPARTRSCGQSGCL